MASAVCHKQPVYASQTAPQLIRSSQVVEARIITKQTTIMKTNNNDVHSSDNNELICRHKVSYVQSQLFSQWVESPLQHLKAPITICELIPKSVCYQELFIRHMAINNSNDWLKGLNQRKKTTKHTKWANLLETITIFVMLAQITLILKSCFKCALSSKRTVYH